MTKSEKRLTPGVTLSFWMVMGNLNYEIHWLGKVSFWAQLCNWNCSGSSAKWTGLSATKYRGHAYQSKIFVCLKCHLYTAAMLSIDKELKCLSIDTTSASCCLMSFHPTNSMTNRQTSYIPTVIQTKRKVLRTTFKASKLRFSTIMSKSSTFIIRIHPQKILELFVRTFSNQLRKHFCWWMPMIYYLAVFITLYVYNHLVSLQDLARATLQFLSYLSYPAEAS